MNNILYNISLILFFLGIILMTIYITKVSNNSVIYNHQQRHNQLNIYDYRVSKEYKKMFSQPSIWLGYQDFDSNDSMQKIYVK